MCEEKVGLAFVTNGGAGTLFIQANFIYYVSRYLKDEPVIITVFAHKSQALSDAVFAGQDFVVEYYTAAERHRALAEYDVSINLNFYPEVLSMREEKISLAPRLRHLLVGWKNYLESDDGRSFYATHFSLDISGQILAVLQGKNCLNVLDVTEELGVSRDYALSLILHKSEVVTLKQWGLEAGNYITLQRGAYPTLNVREVPKIWPVAYYEELVRLLKKCFPEKKIVQLGESEKQCHRIDGIDISLIGKTDWEDLKVLLKNAWLHIDGECGMVHLRKMLYGGPSVVLFGPTSMDFYGYDENINIVSKACPHWCCKLFEDSAERCILDGENNNQCMRSIYPFQVMDRIVEWDYAMNLKHGGLPKRGIQAKDIEQKGICFDDDFANKIFPGRYVYYYELKNVPLRELHTTYRENHDLVKRPLEESPAYSLLRGNSDEYQAELVRQETMQSVECHSFIKFHKLCESMKKGYNEQYKIVVWPDGRVYDGHHRASFLLWKNGLDCIKEVLVTYSVVLFPFHKVPRGSRIVLYGFGEIGENYLRQIRLSGYVSVVGIIDRQAERLMYLDKTLGVEVGSPDFLFSESLEYDYIVLALGNPQSVKEVKEILLKNKIIENKIIVHDGMVYI